MVTTNKLDKDEQDKNIDIKLYHIMVDSLLYLTASRLDIIFSICLSARFQCCPIKSHLIMVKCIFRYLKGTIGISLWYPKTRQFSMMSYSDVDYTDCRVDRNVDTLKRPIPRQHLNRSE